MQFSIRRGENTWELTPMSGKFEGQVVATVDGINLRHVSFAGKTAVGLIKAVWGLNVVMDEIYGDPCTFQGLHIGGTFSTDIDDRVTLDFDGYLDAANRLCRTAKRLLLIGDQIYGEGLQ